MALLLFRFGIVVTIGLCAFNGPVSVYGFINEKGPDPRIKFILEPPSTGLVSKNLPLLLSCSVNVTVDSSGNSNQDYDSEYADDDLDNAEEYDDYNDNIQTNHDYTRHRTDQTVKNKHDKEYHEDEEEDDDEEGEEEENSNRRKRGVDNLSMANRKNRMPMVNIRYTWFRNDKNISDSKLNGFRLFSNGTLKIYFTENASGVYRCLANETESNAGAILSRKCSVNVAVFQRVNNTDSNITGTVGYPLVIPCPVKSFPPAEINWYFNRALLDFNINDLSPENRYFKLANGSLLITRVRGIDNGKYKCAAKNKFLPKPQRNFTATVSVIPFDEFDTKHGLLPSLQNETIKLASGTTLEIFCIGYSVNDEIRWIFTSRINKLPRVLIVNSHVLRIQNVSVLSNDGVYVCQSGNFSQIFNVVVLSPPVFQHIIMSINTSVVATVSLNCSATGNPPPKLTWFRNGQPLEGNLRMNYDNPLLKIYTIDPDDEGIYQCFAENEAGENHIAGYVTVRRRQIFRKPLNVKCYPINHSTVLMKYETSQTIKLMGSYMASENPYEWTENGLFDFSDRANFTIEKNMVPLKTYTIYLRGFLPQNKHNYQGSRRNDFYHLTKLSEPVKCATQGLNVQSEVYENRIYLWWPKIENIRPKKLILQFWYNDTSNPAIFSDHIIGTYNILDEFIKWSDVETNFVKIPAATKINYITNDNNNNHNSSNYNSNKKSNVTIIDVEMPGNVTGILIPNTNKLVVRLLGSVYDDNGEPFEQDLRYVEWNIFDGSAANIRNSLNFRKTQIEARSMTLAWNNLAFRDRRRCIKICYKIIAVLRHDPTTECIPINADLSQETIKKLVPDTWYRFVLLSCDGKEEFGTVDEVTKRDVPGPVNWHNISTTDGVTLFWTPPINADGKLQYYLIQWTKNGENDSAMVNVTINSYKFVNATNTDIMTISIRAVSTSGEGHPIYISIPIGNEYGSRSEKISVDPTLGIVIGSLLSCVCILFCIIYIIRDRTCKKHGRNLNNNRSLPIGPTTGAQCTSDVHEMQTLISRADMVIVPNGYNRNSVVVENTPNIVSTGNNDITTSSELNSVEVNNVSMDNTYVEDIPPAPDDLPLSVRRDQLSNGAHSVYDDDGSSNTRATTPAHVNGNTNKVHNGVIKNLPPPPPPPITPTTTTLTTTTTTAVATIQNSTIPTTTHSISTNPSSKKINGNLKIINNYPQYLNNSAFTLDNSQQILLDTTLDNTTTNLDYDDDNLDHNDELINDSELLNETSHSTRPLTSSTWNYRRPIIGPNG